MKFKFEAISTFKTDVEVTLPNGEQQTFTGAFTYLDDEANEEAVKASNAELLRKVWIGWDGIVDADDKPLAFSAEQRDLLLRHLYIHNAVVSAYVQARAGLRAKN
jgi:hypothetical protein